MLDCFDMVVESCHLLIVKRFVCRRACNPVDLFEAAMQKRCLDDFVNIKVIIMPHPHRVRHNALMTVVCPSVCPMPDPKSRMERHSKMKISMKQAHDTGDP